MSNDFHIYRFDEFSLDEEEKKLYSNGERVPLEPKAFQVLLFLVKNAGRIVSNEEILKEIWRDTFVNESNINIRINAIRKALGQAENRVFIITENKAFKFVVEVEREIKTTRTLIRDITGEKPKDSGFQDRGEKEISELPEVSPDADDAAAFGWRNSSLAVLGAGIAIFFFYLGTVSITNSGIEQNQLIFTILNSFIYGTLAAVTLILESAYEFDKYGWKAARMVPSVWLINSSVMFAALTGAGEFLPKSISQAFFTGFFYLIIGSVSVCLLAYPVLPNVPVTKAKVKTQPAFLAFLKNVGFYFFLFYLFFGLFIFCLIYGSLENYRNILSVTVLFLVWLSLLAFSWISINVFNSNLKTVEDGIEYRYHGLFVSLSYLRVIFCFLPALLNIAVYFFSIN